MSAESPNEASGKYRCKHCGADNRVYTPCEYCARSEWEPVPVETSQRERSNAEIEDGVDCDFVATPGPELVAFGMWRCHCTTIAATLEEVPHKCPHHGSGLLDRPSWEENPHRVPLHKARPSQQGETP